ncbi:hypothetical protein [Clostridium paraputrificum]|uniref:hypothetical protein n=1 Tax=Clostridium paraputrificum TaxID=29363 RepID=UPI002FCDD50B
MNKKETYKSQLSKKRIEEITNSISGLTKAQWNNVKSTIDCIYSEKAAKVKFDSHDETEIVIRMLKL